MIYFEQRRIDLLKSTKQPILKLDQKSGENFFNIIDEYTSVKMAEIE